MYIKTFQHEIPAFDLQPEHVQAAAEVREENIGSLIADWLRTIFTPAGPEKR